MCCLCCPKLTRAVQINLAYIRCNFLCLQVAGIFEKFTEKAIKAVMLAQNFAQKMGASEVSTPVLNATPFCPEPEAAQGLA